MFSAKLVVDCLGIPEIPHCVRDDVMFSGVSIDTRTIKPGMLFVAIPGTSFDGHDFIPEAIAKGALGVICEHSDGSLDVPVWKVKSSTEALAQLATQYRQMLACKTIALTGSNGKTTVKEIIATILPSGSYATRGNLNNHIGVPLCVFELTQNTEYAVFELGASNPYEIAHTVAIVKPDVSLVNNIGPAHLAGFGSIEGVAKAKGEIYQGLGASGIAIVNADEPYAYAWRDSLKNKQQVHFSQKSPAGFYATDINLDSKGCASFIMNCPDHTTVKISLKVPGIHQVSNALAASACTYSIGITIPNIVQGLDSFTGVKGRMMTKIGINGATIIDDTYNANPRSATAAIEVLSHYVGKKILVLGDMLELGDVAASAHEEIGIIAQKSGINNVLTCGKLSCFAAEGFGTGGKNFASKDELVAALTKLLDSSTTVLVKGSRSSKMEEVVNKIVNPIREKI